MFLKYKMIFKFSLVLEEISINPYMDTSVCPSGNDITVCKYGKSSRRGDVFYQTRYGKLVHYVLLLGNRI